MSGGRLRIAVLVNDFGPPWDEAGKNNARAVAAALAGRHDVVCVGLGAAGGEERVEGLRAMRCGSPFYRSSWKRLFYPFGYLNLIWRGAELLEDFRPQVLLCFWETASTALPAAALRALAAPEARLIQVVWTDSYQLEAASPAVWLSEHLPNLLFNGELVTRIAIRQVDCVVATSRYLAGRMRAAGAREVVVGGHGVDVERFAPGPASAPRPRPVVGYLGHATHAKGLGVLLEALGPAAARGELELALALSDSPEAAALERAALPGVRFAGYCPPEEFYSGCDLLVFPRISSYGTASYPNAVLEAMACGRCVLTTRQPAIDEIVREGETGFLVEPGDATALRERALALLADEGKRRSVGDSARAFVLSELSWPRALEPLVRLLEREE
ncbi:MAG: glycosyltransferase family 4 protein [Candidatus Wallbacteria bacterium]|nr:glycosyltransferase family 4 protein [Candidatus Wallbacteria bacterium]